MCLHSKVDYSNEMKGSRKVSKLYRWLDEKLTFKFTICPKISPQFTASTIQYKEAGAGAGEERGGAHEETSYRDKIYFHFQFLFLLSH